MIFLTWSKGKLKDRKVVMESDMKMLATWYFSLKYMKVALKVKM